MEKRPAQILLAQAAQMVLYEATPLAAVDSATLDLLDVDQLEFLECDNLEDGEEIFFVQINPGAMDNAQTKGCTDAMRLWIV